MKYFTFVALLFCVAFPIAAQPYTRLINDAPVGEAPIEVPKRAGFVELQTAETIEFLTEAVRDARYLALKQIVTDRGLSLSQMRAKAAILPEGDRTLFLPVVDAAQQERGHLATDGHLWSLAIDLPVERGQVVETYRATLAADGRAVVEAVPSEAAREDGEHADESLKRAIAPNAVIKPATRTCRYVSSFRINYGCVNLRSNPFGYYYVTTTRTGPSGPSYSWRACYRGAAHVCPIRDDSVFNMPTCGFPPGHPLG